MSASPPAAATWEIHDTVPDGAGGVVDAGIGVFNDAAAPLHQVVPLSCFARSPAGAVLGGAVLGGAVGRTWGGCCELQQLWVHEAHRRAGIGRGLMQRFEARAGSRGCYSFYLETFSFQAPRFYQALGYGVHAQIGGFPDGIIKYLMFKHLPPGPV